MQKQKIGSGRRTNGVKRMIPKFYKEKLCGEIFGILAHTMIVYLLVGLLVAAPLRRVVGSRVLLLPVEAVEQVLEIGGPLCAVPRAGSSGGALMASRGSRLFAQRDAVLNMVRARPQMLQTILLQMYLRVL